MSGIRMFRYRVKGRRKGARVLVDVNRHPDPRAAMEAMLGPLDRFEALEGAAVRAADEVPAAAPVEPAHSPPADVVAESEEISDLVAPEPSQLEPPQVSEPGVDAEPEVAPSPAPEPEPSAFIGFGHEDPDYDWRGWPGPSPEALRQQMPQQAALPRLVSVNAPPPEDDLIRLLPPKLPTDNAVSWECRAHDVLRAWRVEWFRAQRLVREQSAARDWSKHCPLRLGPARDSP